jgi:hypothetical protein
MTRLPARVGALAAAVLFAATTAYSAPEFTRAPYVQLATDTSIQIIWRTGEAILPGVRFGMAPDALDQAVPDTDIAIRRTAKDGSSSTSKPLHSAPEGTIQFEAQLSGLEPDTTYYYGVYNGDQRLSLEHKTFRFKTHPVPGTDRPVYFWVVGDSGTGGSAQRKVHNAMQAFNEEHGRELDLYLHVGDMAYGSGTDREFSDRFFAMYDTTLRNTVCWAAMGNHEGRTSKGESGVGPYYDCYACPTKGEAGGVPSGKEAYYSFDFGRVHFIVLDSHDLDRRPSGAMAQWLKADLEKTTADWMVAYFHHPPYTKGSHDSDKEHQLIEMRELIMPILEGGGVDIVFTGHSHIYERSMLIDGAYATPTTADGVVFDDGDGNPAGDGAYRKSEGIVPHNGTIQVVTGHGGTGVSRKGTSPIMRSIWVENGSTLISIEGDTLMGSMLNLDGVVRDTFAIKKGGTVEHRPIENPWQPPAKKDSGKKGGGKKMPKGATPLIAEGANWKYLAGEDPVGDWTSRAFSDDGWKSGQAGIGYGDKDDATALPDMKGKYKTVYARKTFTLPEGADASKLGLGASYDDGFIAYINGKEVLRVGVDSGSGATAKGFHPHEADGKFEFFPLPKAAAAIAPGVTNVLAIEGHNANLTSSDFTLHPTLLIQK